MNIFIGWLSTQVVDTEDHIMFVRVAVRFTHTDEGWMIENTVCRVLGFTTKKEKDHA